MKYYKRKEDWIKDMDIFKNNPNDLNFFSKITTRVNNSSAKVKEEIQELMEEDMFRETPYEYMLVVINSLPDKMLVINSKNNVWFEV